MQRGTSGTLGKPVPWISSPSPIGWERAGVRVVREGARFNPSSLVQPKPRIRIAEPRLFCSEVDSKMPPHSTFLRLSQDALASEKVVLCDAQLRRVVGLTEQRVDGLQALLSREPLCGWDIDAGDVLSQQIRRLAGTGAEELHQRADTQALRGFGEKLLGFAKHLAVNHRIDGRDFLF